MAEFNSIQDHERIQRKREEWTAIKQEQERTTDGQRAEVAASARNQAILLVSVVGAVLVGILWWIGSAISNGGNSAAEDQATQIVTDCTNVVQPLDWPRLSPYEEQAIMGCSLAATDDPAVEAAIRDYGMDGR